MSSDKRGKLMYAISDEDDSPSNNPINLLDTVNRDVRVEQPKILLTVKQELEDKATVSRFYFVRRGNSLVPVNIEPKQAVSIPVKIEGNISEVDSNCRSIGQGRIRLEQDVSIPVKSEGNISEVDSTCGSIGQETPVKSEGYISEVNSTCRSIGKERYGPSQIDVSIQVKSEGSVCKINSVNGITSHVSAPVYASSVFGKQPVVIKSDLPVNKPTFDILKGDFQLTCDICGARFRFPDVLEKHRSAHTGEKLYVCEVCGKEFDGAALWMQHLKYHSRKHKEKGAKPNKTKTCLCHVCGKVFSRKEQMVFHLKFHSKERPHICQVCGKGFAVKQLLNKHMGVHSSDRPYSCDMCDSRFKRKNCLGRHKKKYHSSSGIKPRRKFVRKDVLYCVKEKFHSKERPHICQVCSKGFAVRQGLERHMSVHSSDQPYPCDICGSRFKRENSMVRHKKKYHSSSGIKPRRKFVRKDVLYCAKEKTQTNDQHMIEEPSSS